MGYQPGMATNETLTQLSQTAESQKWPTQCDPALAFERQELVSLLAVWRHKAGGGVPARAAFDMRTLKSFAPHILILERVGQGEARRYKFRLFGSAHLQLFGEHTGHFLDQMVAPEILPSWNAIYDAILQAREPLRIVAHFRMASSDFLRGEMFAAPMTDANGAENMILAATYVRPQDAVLSPFDPD